MKPPRPTKVAPVASTELEAVRRREMDTPTKPNIFIGTLNLVAGPMRSILDPVKKVCYPHLEAHWENKYKNRFPRHAGKLLVFDLALLFLASALAVGLIMVYRYLPTTAFDEPLLVALRQPTALVSGTQTELVISYLNGSDALVRNATLTVETTDDFVTAGSPQGQTAFVTDPERPTNRTFDLADLPPHARGQVTLSGRAYGTPGATLSVLVRLNYWEEGRAEPSTVPVFYKLPFASSPLQLEMKFDEPLMADTVNTVRINYENTGEEMLPGVSVRFSPPPDFRVTGGSPVLGRNATWRLGDLEPHERGTLIAYGSLKRGAAPSFTAIGMSNAPDGENRMLNELRLNADAVSTGFVLTHEIAGRLSFLAPGQEAEVLVRYANTGDRTVENATVTLTVEGAYLADAAAFPLVWTPDSDPQLAAIEPGGTGTLTAKLKLADLRTQEELDDQANQAIRLTSEAEYYVENVPVRAFHTDSGVTDLPVTTALRIDAAALYETKAGDRLGVGPIPPRANEKTRLWVVVTVENGTNAIRNAHLEASLMPAANWTGETSVTTGKPLAYVASDRKIIWEIGDIPAFAGGYLPRATANFEIEVQPGEDDIGTAPVLLDYIIIEGEDAFTGTKVTAKGAAVTTAVRFGTDEAQKGEVIE